MYIVILNVSISIHLFSIHNNYYVRNVTLKTFLYLFYPAYIFRKLCRTLQSYVKMVHDQGHSYIYRFRLSHKTF